MKLHTSHILHALAGGPPEGHRLDDLLSFLGLETGQRGALRDALLEMVRGGRVVRRGRRYALPVAAPLEQAAPVRGLLRMNTQGRGFVDVGDGAEEVLVAHEDLGGALDGDTVEVHVWPGETRRQGRVVGVLSRGRTRVTGVLRKGAPPVLDPDDPRLPLRVEITDPGAARGGQAVLAEIETYPTHLGAPLRARVTRVLGEPGILPTEVARSVAGAGVEEAFPEPVIRAAGRTPEAVREVDLLERLDLRQQRFVTIDPQTARDFDDAVAIEEARDGITRVWVAVADVSEYVREGSVLDQEARRRGCSLYLPDRAIPMLPPALSSGICSLVPGEDRLAVAVRLDVTEEGQIVDEGSAAVVIHSAGRLDYESVAAALQGDLRGRRSAYRDHLSLLERLARVAGALHRRRLARGSLELDLPEMQILLDEDDPNRVRDIRESRPDAPVKRAYGLIEELMVAANEAVGRAFEAAGVDTIWRVHARPTLDALSRLAVVVGSYGVKASPERLVTERGMAQLLHQLDGHPAGRALSYLVLRTLKQAVYGVSNIGHFGLASPAYLHFTSPIRRYPDLHVHRLFKRLIRRRGWPAGRPLRVRQASPEDLQAIARESSLAERRAIEVEREVQSVYAASLLRDRIGDEEWGTISGVTSFGFFVALDEPFVEGLVRMDRLREWVDFVSDQLRLLGRRSGHAFSLGDRVQVRIVGTSVARRQIDLELVEHEASEVPLPTPGNKGRAKPRVLGGRTGARRRR
jgi:ribonuclease R